MNIGFIGLGVMGAPMAGHLADAGHTIFTCLNRSPLPAELSGKAVEVVGSPAEVAAHCDTVIVMVPDTPDVQRVITGENGVLINVHDGTLVIDMSSISPIATQELAAAVNAKGGQYVDAPVSGGEVGAKAASLTIMCGGPQAAFDRAAPLFEVMGKNITLISENNGAGQTCKIANQIIVALNIEAVGEALVFASKAGCDPAKVREALMGRAGDLPHSRGAWRTDDQTDHGSGFPHQPAPEGSEPGAELCQSAWRVAAQHRNGAGIVQFLRGPWWGE